MDAEKIRKDFPIFKRKINGKPVAYLDNAATSQKPIQVLDAMDRYYKEYSANVHRGIYRFSEEATEEYENARNAVAEFIDAGDSKVIFTKNATEALNLVAYSWGEENIHKGDKIVVSVMEHHSNLVPWQQLAQRKGAKLEFLDINTNSYELNEKEFQKIQGATLVAVTHVSNVLGTINPVNEICKRARESEAVSIVDGAQSAPHMKVDVKRMGCDFFIITGHKMLGPTGIGALIGNTDLLGRMKPFQYGGDMIREVFADHSVWNDLPYKFEAGTPNISGAIGLGAAIKYLKNIGMDAIREHEIELTKYALKKLEEIEKLDTYGTKDLKKRAGVIPFNLNKIHPHDVASLLDEDGIAIRSGHHCAMPLHTRLKLESTNRASFYMYNTKQDIDQLCKSLENAKKVFGVDSNG